MKRFIVLVMTIACLAGSPVMAEEQNHEGTAHTEGGAIKLTPAQMTQAGIQIETVGLKPVPQTIRAPGTVAFNNYRLADVTSLVDGAVHARHVRLGDKVIKGQKLVTLTSTALAQSEADFLRAEAEHRKSKQEWTRLKELAGQKIISQARLQQAASIHQSTHAALLAARASLASYGLRDEDIDGLIKGLDYGKLVLRSPDTGTVVSDDFRTGQHIAAGDLLLRIADESTVWIETRVSESEAFRIRLGQSASIALNNSAGSFEGKVVALHHQIDPTTRTAGVRLEIQNPDDALDPGMFVDAQIQTGAGEEALLLPEQAVQRQGSELIIFVEEEAGLFERREVQIGKANMGMVPLLEGVKPGERVVIKGAFALISELAKAGFEVHNH